MDLVRLADFLQNEENKVFYQCLYHNEPFSINQTARLISDNHNAPIHDLLTLIRLQKKNKEKNPYGQHLIFDEKGIEQSSSWKMAEYHGKKTEKYASIADLCCGIGVDLLHLAKKKERIYAVDTDAQKIIAAKYNVNAFYPDIKVGFLQQPAEKFFQKVNAVFIDPDRRFFDKRIIEPEMMNPPLSAILKLTKITPDVMIKLSPVFAYQKLRLEQDYTLEFISENGNLKEILVCMGNFIKPGINKIALLLNENVILDDSMQRREKISSLQSFLFEPDSAVIRSGLVQQCAAILQLDRINEQLALLTGDYFQLTKLGTYFIIKEAFIYQLKRLQTYLSDKQIGDLEIKTRGFPIPVETFRKKIKLHGKNQATLFIIRHSDKHFCIFCVRVKENTC
jgi:hypothetical protein